MDIDEKQERTTKPVLDGPRYPMVVVQLVGQDGNAFQLIGRVRQALRRNRVPDAVIEEFSTEAMSGDYDNVLATIMRWVSI